MNYDFLPGPQPFTASFTYCVFMPRRPDGYNPEMICDESFRGMFLNGYVLGAIEEVLRKLRTPHAVKKFKGELKGMLDLMTSDQLSDIRADSP